MGHLRFLTEMRLKFPIFRKQMKESIQMFKYYWEDFSDSGKLFLGEYQVSEKEILDFGIKYDPQYFHIDPVLAKESNFGGLIACGWHTCSILMRLMCEKFLVDTSSMGSPGVDKLRWLVPLKPGDIVRGYWKLREKRESKSKENLGIIKASVWGINQEGQCIITLEPTFMVFKSPKTN